MNAAWRTPNSNPHSHPKNSDQSLYWHVLTQIAFRFCVVYFGLFFLLFAQVMFIFSGVVGAVLPPEAPRWQMSTLGPVTEWVGQHVFGVAAALDPDSPSGDQTAMWVMVFTMVIVAVVATALWSVADRRHFAYPRLHAWMLVSVRMCLGGQLLLYGAYKVIPVQMPSPPLTSLLRPFGQLTLPWVLWLQVGSSYPYEIALGAAELAVGVLLFWPRTATLGALLAVGSMAQVFLINMTYDISVKIISFHLLVLALVLLAPHARQLANVLLLERSSAPLTQPALFTTARSARIATAIQLGVGVWTLAGALLLSGLDWTHYGGGRPKPELYGIWSVTSFTRDGTSIPPLTTEQGRWQRLIIDDPGQLSYQRMDSVIVTTSAFIDPHTITAPHAPAFAALTIHRIAPDQLRLSGQLAGQPVTMMLQRLDLASFPLRGNHFHWIHQYPDTSLE